MYGMLASAQAGPNPQTTESTTPAHIVAHPLGRKGATPRRTDSRIAPSPPDSGLPGGARCRASAQTMQLICACTTLYRQTALVSGSQLARPHTASAQVMERPSPDTLPLSSPSEALHDGALYWPPGDRVDVRANCRPDADTRP